MTAFVNYFVIGRIATVNDYILLYAVAQAACVKPYSLARAASVNHYSLSQVVGESLGTSTGCQCAFSLLPHACTGCFYVPLRTCSELCMVFLRVFLLLSRLLV